MTKDRLWVVLGLALAILPLTAHRYGRVGDGRNYEGRWRATVSGARRGFREERAFGGSRVYWRPNVASHCRRGSRYVSRGRSGAVGAEPPSLFLSCCFGDDGVRSVFRALEGRMVSRRLRGVCGRVGCHRRRFCSFPNGAPLWQLRFYASCPARCSAWAAVCSPWYGANALDGWMLRRAPGFRFSSYSLPACWRPSLSP